MDKCETCGLDHDGSYGSGRFCCVVCARSYASNKLIRSTKKMKCSYCDNIVDIDIRSSIVTCTDCKQLRYIKYKKICPTCSNEYITQKRHQKFCSQSCSNNFPENFEQNRIRAQNREFGGHTSKKSFYYECIDGSSVYLQSSYEYTLAKDLDANGILWVRPTPLLWVDLNNIPHKYYPDFYLIDYDVYLDPKNDYLIVKDEYKITEVSKQNNVKVVMLNKTQLSWNGVCKILNTHVA